MAHRAEDILLRWPTLEGLVEPEEFDAAIADAEAQLSATVWGTLYDLACIHKAAHMLMLSKPDKFQTAQVTSESIGGVSRTYSVSSSSSTSVNESTPAGREFTRLRRMLGPAISLG